MTLYSANMQYILWCRLPSNVILQANHKRRVGFTTPEEEWRHDCLAFARLKDLSRVEEMKAFYFDARSDGEGEGCVTVAAVGAHYRRNVASQEECLLHIVKVPCLLRGCFLDWITYADLGVESDTLNARKRTCQLSVHIMDCGDARNLTNPSWARE